FRSVSKKTSAAPSASFESAILRNDEIRHVFDQVEGVITACGEHSQTDAVDGAADSQLAGEAYGVRVGSDVVDEFVFRLDAGGLDAGAHLRPTCRDQPPLLAPPWRLRHPVAQAAT
ncbi:hypothetical protein, partial [Bifidobacterium bifidum]|uniref:hypothetical protein n=1 Tax=Bifidobacterium bifidum TaxID=1681 RepID=UPI001C706019